MVSGVLGSFKGGQGVERLVDAHPKSVLRQALARHVSAS